MGDEGGGRIGGHALDPVAGAVRSRLWVPDGQPPPRWTMARELSVAKLMMRHGETPAEIVEAIRGLAQMRELGQLGGLAQPGDKLTLKVFTTAKQGHGVPLYRMARHVARKEGTERGRELAMQTIGEALQAAARTGGG